MLILTADQIRQWDQYTIDHEPVSEAALINRTALACVQFIEEGPYKNLQQFYIFCGKGNNGADGLAIARLLKNAGKSIEVYILEYGKPGSAGFQFQFNQLHEAGINIHFIQENCPFPAIPSNAAVIDCLIGTGLNRSVSGMLLHLIEHLNLSAVQIISVDLPSGIKSDESTFPATCIKATHTLALQCYKPAMMLAENGPYLGILKMLDIGLHPDFPKEMSPIYQLVDSTVAKAIYRPRKPYTHKGNFGHALIVGGSYGKMGAAILAAKACLRTGTGMLTCLIPEKGLSILQTALPEAMAIVSGEKHLSGQYTLLSTYKAVGCGTGIGTDSETALVLEGLLNNYSNPMIWDADAVNLLSQNEHWWQKLPPFSILTPHPKEFDRIAGPSSSESDRWEKAKKLAYNHQLIIILKGQHSLVAMPGGSVYFNMSGNASMAKAGSGDALTGMLTALLSHGYAPEEAALLGVYLHGKAGELASEKYGMESVLATDIIEKIGNAFQLLDV